jgi:hypothetical protein
LLASIQLLPMIARAQKENHLSPSNQATSHNTLIELLVSFQIVGWAFIRIEFPIVRMKSASISRKDQTFA